MTNIVDYFKNDPLWQKMKAGTIKSEKKLSKVKYLRAVGWESYSKEAYERYVRNWEDEQKEELDELPF